MRSLVDIFDRIKANKTIKQGSLYTIFSFFGQGISFVLLVLLANFIEPREYGQLSLYNTALMLVGFFMGFSSSGYVAVSYFKETGNGFVRDFSAIISLYFLTTLVFALLLLSAGSGVSKLMQLPEKLIWYVVIVAFFNSIFSIYQNYARVREKIGLFGVFSCGNAILNFVLSLVFVIELQQSWIGRVNAQLVCAVLFGLIALLSFIKYRLFVFNFSWERYKTILLYSLPLIPHLATMWIRQGCDRYIINYNYSVYEVGLFSFALNLSSITSMIGLAFNYTNSVSLYKLLANKEGYCDIPDRIDKLTRITFYIYSAISVTLIIILPSIVYLLLPKYVPSLGYYFVLCISTYLECLYLLYCNYLFYYGKTKQIMAITLGTSSIHLLLSLLLTKYSLYFTCVIYSITFGLILLFVYYSANKLRVTHNLIKR